MYDMSKSSWAGHTQYLEIEIKKNQTILRSIAFGNGLKMYELEDRFIISIRFAHDDIDGSLAEHRIYHAHNY